MKKNAQDKPQLSVVLATYNEAANLARCLTSVQSIATEIIIVDGQSTDTTVAIAKQFHAKIFSTTNKKNFHINKQIAIDHANCPWILQLDADEVITKPLATEIISSISQPTPYAAFYIKRKNFFLGTFLKKGGQYPDPVIRLFKKNQARLPQQDVHEQLQVDGSIGVLTEPMEHYTAPSFSRYLTNSNRYTSFSAGQYQTAKLSKSPLTFINYIFLKPSVTFVKIYLRHKGFVDGFPGFVFALFSGLHHAIAYLKYLTTDSRS